MLRINCLHDTQLAIAKLRHLSAVNFNFVRAVQTSNVSFASAKLDEKTTSGYTPKPSVIVPKPSSTTSYSTVKPNTKPKGSRFGKFMKSMSITLVTVGGIVGYSLYDSQFTKSMNEHIPIYEAGIDKLHGLLSGYLPQLPDRKLVPYSGQLSKESVGRSVTLPLPPSSNVSSGKPPTKSGDTLVLKLEAKQPGSSKVSEQPKVVDVKKDLAEKVTKSVQAAEPKPSEKPAENPLDKSLEKQSATNTTDKPFELMPASGETSKLKEVSSMDEEPVQKAVEPQRTIDPESSFVDYEAQVIAALQKATRSVDSALLAQSEAQISIEAHTHTLKAALESTEIDPRVMNEFWSNEVRAGQRRTEAVSDAKRALQLALVALADLDAQLRIDGNAQPDKAQQAAKSPTCAHAKVDLTRLRAELERANESVAEAMRIFSAFHEVETRLLDAKLTLERDLHTVLPNVKLDHDLRVAAGADSNSDTVRLSSTELNALISYVLSRTAHLQATIARQSAAHREELTSATRRERDAALRASNADAFNEIERLKRAHADECSILEANLRAQHDAELRAHSERQLAVFIDSLRRRLAEQDALLSAKHAAALDEQRILTRREAEAHIVAADTHVRAIEAAVNKQAASVARVRVARDLFVACAALESAVDHSNIMVPLDSLIGHVNTALDDSTTTLTQFTGTEADSISAEARDLLNALRNAVGNIPSTARTRGVVNERALIDRYDQLQGHARRVALVRETGGSLYEYIVSYIESALTVRTRRLLGPDHEFSDVRELNAYTALHNADYHLRHGDLEQAVRFVNQLRGQARVVFAEWLDEARLFLEVRQSARLLIAIAASMQLSTVARAS